VHIYKELVVLFNGVFFLNTLFFSYLKSVICEECLHMYHFSKSLVFESSGFIDAVST
jgi:hypothetical protein